MRLVIATGKALIVLEFFLDHLKLLLTDDSRNLGHDNPVFWRHGIETANAASDRFERGNASGRRSIVIASCIYCTRIHGICQNVVDGAITPMTVAAWASYPKLSEMFGETTQGVSFLLIVRKHLGHRCRFGRLQSHPCWIPWMSRASRDTHRVEAPKGAACLHDTFAVSHVSCGQQSSCARIRRQPLGSGAIIDRADPGSSVARQTRPGTHLFPVPQSRAFDGYTCELVDLES